MQDYFLYAMVRYNFTLHQLTVALHLLRSETQIVPVMPTALSDRAGVPYADRTRFPFPIIYNCGTGLTRPGEYWVTILLMSEAAVALLCCPLFGYLVDISRTRQLPYLLGLILLAAAMAMLSVAHTVWLFVAARLLQGGATAMVAVAGLALMTDSVPFGNLGQAIGYLGSAITLGFMLGPLLGGLVFNVAGYTAVFAMAFAVIAVDFAMRVLVVEKKVARRWMDHDGHANGQVTGDANHANGRAGNGSINGHAGGYHTFPHPPAESENNDRAGFALLKIAREPRVLVSLWALMVQGVLYTAFDAVCSPSHQVQTQTKTDCQTIPVFVESTYGWTPFEAGMTFLPSAITAIFEPYFGISSPQTRIHNPG